MFKFGIISDFDANKGFFRVNFDGEDVVSPWMPRILPNTKSSKDEIPFDQGEHVACLMDEHGEAGVILGAIYSGADTPSVKSKTVRSTTFSDGTVIKYDTQSKELNINAKGKVIIQSADKVEVTATGAEIDFSCTKLKVTGDVEVTGKISATTGISSDLDVTANASIVPISLLTHTHTAPSGGGATGPPLP